MHNAMWATARERDREAHTREPRERPAALCAVGDGFRKRSRSFLRRKYRTTLLARNASDIAIKRRRRHVLSRRRVDLYQKKKKGKKRPGDGRT